MDPMTMMMLSRMASSGLTPQGQSPMGGGSTAYDESSSNPWMKSLGVGSMAGGLAGLFNSPSNAAMGYSNKLPGTVTPYYQPYIDAGQRSLGTLEEQYNQLINNPQSIYDMLAPKDEFEQSPGYQWQYDQAMQGASNAAAAGGMAGGSAHQQQAATTASGLANQDYYNWINQIYNPEFERMLGLYGSGMSGLSGLNTMGYNASDSLAGLLAQNLMNQASLAAANKQQQNSSLGSLVGGATAAFGF